MKTTIRHSTLLAAIVALVAPTAAHAAVEPVIDGDTYTFTVESGTETYSTTLSGDVKVVKGGAGTLVLGASANTFTGGIEVYGGTLKGSYTALGGRNTSTPPHTLIKVADGATLLISDTTGAGSTYALASELRVSGHGVSNAGAVQRTGGKSSLHGLFRKITLEGDTTLSASVRWGLGSSEGASLDMGGHDLKILGSGTFEFYNTSIDVSNPGSMNLAGGTLLMQGDLGAAPPAGSAISLASGTTLQFWDWKKPLSWPVTVPASATIKAGSGTARTANAITGDIFIGTKLTMNLDAATRVATFAGDIDGPGELLMNSAGTLYVTGAVERTIGKFTQTNGKVVLENAGTFSVTNRTVGTDGFFPNTPSAYVGGSSLASAPRIVVTNATLKLPESSSSTAASAKKHHLFVGSPSDTAETRYGVLDIRTGGTVTGDLNIGRAKGGVGAVILNGGSLNWPAGSGNQGWLGHEGVGYLAINSGTFTTEGVITIGRTGNSDGNGGIGIVHQRGGSVITTGSTANDMYFYALRLARENNSYAHWYQTGGTSTLGSHLALCYADKLLTQSGNEAVVTLSGENTAMSIADGRYLEACVSSNATTSVVNLNDGATLTVRRIFKNYASVREDDATATTAKFKDAEIRESVAASKFYVNFDGGILKPAQYGTIFNSRGGIYDDPDRVTVYAGGAIVDTSLCTSGTTDWSAPIQKPSGNVLLSVSLPTDSAWVNKYIAPPRVVISGVNQHGATAVAEFDEANQRITGITVTSPGNDVPGDITVTIKSGNLASTFNCPFTVGAPARDGGFTKRGANVLNLNMAAGSPNTYEGPTTVEGGTLKFENGTYPASSPLVLKGGTLALGGYAVTVPSIEGYGEITGSGGVTVTGELRVSCADIFGEGRSIAAQKVTLASGVRLVITDPENLAQYRSADSAVFLTASVSLSGDAPLVDSAADGWRCSKSGDSLKFGFPKPFVLVIR